MRWPLLAAGLLLLPSVSAASVEAQPPSPSRFDCQTLATAQSPDTARQWLERSRIAEHCYTFRARAVRITRQGVQTLMLAHELHDGMVREIASFLDGPAIIYERGSQLARRAIPDSDDLPSELAQLERHYRFEIDCSTRVAGRSSICLSLEPRDNQRYGHRLWLDEKTGLPLKRNLLGTDGRILETFQMIDLAEPELYEQGVVLESAELMPSGPWQPGWLPAGFERKPLPRSRNVLSQPVEQRLYSDGLASFTLFVEPLDENGATLKTGLHAMGVSHVAVRHMQLNDRLMQIVVVGELPPEVLLRIASQMRYRPGE